MLRRPPISTRPYTLFPYTTLVRSAGIDAALGQHRCLPIPEFTSSSAERRAPILFDRDRVFDIDQCSGLIRLRRFVGFAKPLHERFVMMMGNYLTFDLDRKSNRLNSSH